MTVTINSIETSTCNHRTLNVTIDGHQRDITIHANDITEALPESLDEFREAFLLVLRHQYKTRRAAGRTHAQAVADLVGFTVRV